MAVSIDADMRAMRALALAVWKSLSMAQRAALSRARVVDHGGALITYDTRRPVIDALVARGLADPVLSSTGTALTAEGLLVRATGKAHIQEQAHRRWRRREVNS